MKQSKPIGMIFVMLLVIAPLYLFFSTGNVWYIRAGTAINILLFIHFMYHTHKLYHSDIRHIKINQNEEAIKYEDYF